MQHNNQWYLAAKKWENITYVIIMVAMTEWAAGDHWHDKMIIKIHSYNYC